MSPDIDPTPQKQANKADPSAAESVEGRGSTKGNAEQTLLAPDTAPGKRGMGLLGVREAAKRDKKQRFTALLHHVTPELLQELSQLIVVSAPTRPTVRFTTSCFASQRRDWLTM